MTMRFAVVLDFEATCDEPDAPDPQEVIEFPSVLLDRDVGVIDTFESFVRPEVHPEISASCTSLTSITTSDVAGAQTFPKVFARHQRWLRSHGVNEDNGVIVTCGDWDLNRMLPKQLRTSEVAVVPRIYTRWLNIKVPFSKHHPVSGGMKGMLETLGLPLLGRHHRGIDDCHNITAILRALLEKGTPLEPTKTWRPRAWPPLPLMLLHESERLPVELRPRTLDALRGLAQTWLKKRVELWNGAEKLTQDQLFDLAANTEIEVRLS